MPARWTTGNNDESARRGCGTAATVLAQTSSEAKNAALRLTAAALRERRAEILAANASDMAAARSAGASDPLLDRLHLNEARIEAMAQSMDDIIALPDPVGTISARVAAPNGLRIQRVRVPLGVIGIIYESRPNVTADAGALCLKSGNAVILRGG